jgi:hypothetical protein
MTEYSRPENLESLLQLFKTEEELQDLFPKVIQAGLIWADLLLKGRPYTEKELGQASQALEIVVEKNINKNKISEILGEEIDVKSPYEIMFSQKGLFFQDTSLSHLMVQLIQAEGNAENVKRMLNDVGPTAKDLRRNEAIQVFPPQNSIPIKEDQVGELSETLNHTYARQLKQALKKESPHTELKLYALPTDIDEWPYLARTTAIKIHKHYSDVSRQLDIRGFMPKPFADLFVEFVHKARELPDQLTQLPDLINPFDVALDNFLKFVINESRIVEIVKNNGTFNSNTYGLVNKLRRMFDAAYNWNTPKEAARKR